MPWKETCVMEQRARFVMDVLKGTYCISELCTAYGVSRKTAYKWLSRFAASRSFTKQKGNLLSVDALESKQRCGGKSRCRRQLYYQPETENSFAIRAKVSRAIIR